MSKGVTENSFYALVDFLGIPITIGKNGITGKGQITTDWGLLKARMVQKVFDSFFDHTTGDCCLLLGTQQDLGIGVVYYPAVKTINVFLLDRSKLEHRGQYFFSGDKPISNVLDGYELLQAQAVAHFRGNVGSGPMEKSTEISSV